jgi:hypothetical protein
MVAGNGTGISVESGTGALIRSAVISNSSRSFGGVSIGEGSTLRVHRSIISNNRSAFGFGGGIQNRGKLVVTQSIITNNGVGSGPPTRGGGIENSGVATLTHSVIANNDVILGDGGGIFNSGKLTLIHSTVLGNRTASCDEPNCSPPQGGRGGGIFNAGSAANTSLIGSFITSNSATLDGGGVFNEDGTVSQTDTLIINNNPNDCVGC